MPKNGDPPATPAKMKKGNEWPGWSADFDKPVCDQCGRGSHHCTTAGCECPVCPH